MSLNQKALEALKTDLIKRVAAAKIWRDTYPGGPDIMNGEYPITPDDVRACRSALVAEPAPQQAGEWVTDAMVDAAIRESRSKRLNTLTNSEAMRAILTAAYLAHTGEQVSEPAPQTADYFGQLVEQARTTAEKASRKFPQPNYVTLKIAEEAGEVVRGAVHYAEGRMEWPEVEGEIVQLLAMLIRFVTEGDQINGVTPPATLAAQETAR